MLFTCYALITPEKGPYTLVSSEKKKGDAGFHVSLWQGKLWLWSFSFLWFSLSGPPHPVRVTIKDYGVIILGFGVRDNSHLSPH